MSNYATSIVNLPLTVFPWMRGSGSTLQPGHTLMDSAVSMSASDAMRGPGDGWPSISLFYVTYIPEAKVVMPWPSFEIGYPFVAYGGDARAWQDLNGSNRTFNQAVVHFGTNHNIEAARQTGMTYLFHCQWFDNGCKVVDQEQLPAEGNIGMLVESHPTSADVFMWVDAANPLSIAPPIDGWVDWKIRPGGSSVTGGHDLMPVHQLWWGNQNAQAYLVYQNDFYNPACLFQGGVPNFPCGGKINARL